MLIKVMMGALSHLKKLFIYSLVVLLMEETMVP